MYRFTPQDLLTWTAGSLEFGELTECTSVFTDSRSPVKGGLFVALQGERFDGHAYIHAVQAAGAAGAVIQQNQVELVVAQL